MPDIRLIATAGVLVVLAVIGISILAHRRKKQEALVEMRTSEIIDRVSFKRAYVNTAYIEKALYDTVQRFVYAVYLGRKEELPAQAMTREMLQNYVQYIDYEASRKISRTLTFFTMNKIRIVGQETSSMNTVSKINVEATFSVDLTRTHSTFQERIAKQFTQQFGFVNVNGSFLLGEVGREEILQQLPANQQFACQKQW